MSTLTKMSVHVDDSWCNPCAVGVIGLQLVSIFGEHVRRHMSYGLDKALIQENVSLHHFESVHAPSPYGAVFDEHLRKKSWVSQTIL